jgi:hypothetical protein
MDDDVANLSGIKPIELVYVQRVRLFLGVMTLNDISLGHQTSSQPAGNGLYECATHPLKLRYWNDQWNDGTNDASTKCGIQLWTPTTASYTCGSMDTFVWACINADIDIDISTDL